MHIAYTWSISDWVCICFFCFLYRHRYTKHNLARPGYWPGLPYGVLDSPVSPRPSTSSTLSCRGTGVATVPITSDCSTFGQIVSEPPSQRVLCLRTARSVIRVPHWVSLCRAFTAPTRGQPSFCTSSQSSGGCVCLHSGRGGCRSHGWTNTRQHAESYSL